MQYMGGNIAMGVTEMNILYIIIAFFTGISVGSIISLIIYNRTKCGDIEGYPEMEIREITFRQACDFVAEHHYYSPTEGGIGCNFCMGLYINDKQVGVAMVCGRPVRIKPDKEFTCEVNRLCTDGTYNGWAMLYDTCYRVVKENGYKKLIIYI